MPRRLGSEDLLAWLFYLAETKTTEVLSPVETRPFVVFLFCSRNKKADDKRL
jgi:hypothetical protein